MRRWVIGGYDFVLFRVGDWVRCTHFSAYGEHGLVSQTSPRDESRVFVVWDNPHKLLGRFIRTEWLEKSDKHTLWLGDYGAFSKEQSHY